MDVIGVWLTNFQIFQVSMCALAPALPDPNLKLQGASESDHFRTHVIHECLIFHVINVDKYASRMDFRAFAPNENMYNISVI